MTLIKSNHAKGRLQAPYAAEAGNVVAARYEIDLDAMGASDVAELGILPAHTRLVDATLVTDGLGGTATASVGLLSDAPGETDDSTTAGNELFDGASVAAAGVTRVSRTDGYLLDTDAADRAIGLTVNESATGKVVLLLEYAAYGDY